MFNNYNVPNGHVFLENELVNIDSNINPLLENFTEDTVESGIEGFIDILINGLTTSKVTSIGQIVGISLAAIPFINTLLVKHQAKAETLVKSNGFSLGLIGGITLAYAPYATRNKLSIKKSIIKSLAKTGLKHTLKSNPKLNMIVYMIINKAATKILKLPDHETLLGDFLKNPSVLFNPVKILRSYLFSLLVGFIVGLFVFKSTFRFIFKNAKTTSLVDIFASTLTGEFRSIGMGVATNNFNEIILGLQNAKIKKPKSDKQFLNLYQKYIQTDKYKINSKSINGTKAAAEVSIKTMKMHKYKLTDISKPQTQILAHIEATVEQAISVLRDNVDTAAFDKYIDSITLVLSDHDSAYISKSGFSHAKYKIFIVIDRNLHNSVWSNFSVREVAAVLAHEFGHFYSGAFRLSPAIKLSYLSIVFARFLISSEQIFKMLTDAAMSYSIVLFAKFAEIQADAYAIQCGFGKELHSSLNKMSYISPLADEFSLLTTHGSPSSRLSGILKWSKIYSKLKKQAKS